MRLDADADATEEMMRDSWTISCALWRESSLSILFFFGFTFLVSNLTATDAVTSSSLDDDSRAIYNTLIKLYVPQYILPCEDHRRELTSSISPSNTRPISSCTRKLHLRKAVHECWITCRNFTSGQNPSINAAPDLLNFCFTHIRHLHKESTAHPPPDSIVRIRSSTLRAANVQKRPWAFPLLHAIITINVFFEGCQDMCPSRSRS